MISRRAFLVRYPATLALGLTTAAIGRDAPGVPGLDGLSPRQERATYLFAQQHRDALPWWRGSWRPQRVSSGARLRIHLPGDPIRWVPDTGSGCRPTPWPGSAPLPSADIELVDHAVIPSPGRIAGAKSLYRFDYEVSGFGVAAACLRPNPVPNSPEALGFPPGSPLWYALTVVVTSNHR